MNRSLKLSMLVALALGTGQALAMDLGQVQVKSALGQPLLAEIPLHPASPSELKHLTVKLASSEDFARAGIVGGRTSIPLHFSVVNAGAGHQVIRITSSAAVNNPFLDLLIEVNGSAGKSVREFAILLDPPHESMAAPAVASAPKMAATPHQRVTRRAAPAPLGRSAPAQTPAPQASVVNGQYGPVEHGQTLSGIARSTAPSGVDVQQMILALQQANPNAFYRKNINALKSGAVLRVPTAAEAQAMSIAAALAEIRRQNSDWRAGTPSQPAVVAAAAARAPAATASGNRDNSDRLALVPAKVGGNGATGLGGDNSDTSTSGVRQDLMRAKESVVSLQQQSTDLKGQLKDLSDINSKNERLLSLKNSEIAELQSKLAAARKTAGLPALAVTGPASAMSAPNPPASTPLAEGDLATATASTSANPATTPVSSGSSAMTGAAMASAASTPKASTPAVVATPAPAVKKPVVSKAATRAAMIGQPWYMQTWTWAVGAGAVVLLILLAMLGRRKRASSDLSKASLADRFGSAAVADANVLDREDLDQEELLDQLAEHPDDIGLHLELVTLYYSRRDVERFEAAAEAMYAHITDPEQDEWQDVLNMGEDLVPEHPLFDHHPELPAREDAEARREFDIDDYANDEDSSSPNFSAPPLLPSDPKKVSEYNFNFDLTQSAVDEAPADDLVPADEETVAAPLLDEVSISDLPMEPEAESSWQFKDSAAEPVAVSGAELGDFSDDPIDTKLDLARAYLDMGDADGARAMLGEVIKEGSQMQQDTARRLLDDIS